MNLLNGKQLMNEAIRRKQIETLKCYTWPNEAFPFRLYFDHPKCRIFILENIQHNWEWFKEYHQDFKPTDYFFICSGWYLSENSAKTADKIFNLLQMNKQQFFIMYNDQKEKENFEQYGFIGDIINNNCWLDENLVMKVKPNIKKIYDAIYVARLDTFKRHYLASKVDNLALVAGRSYGTPINDIPNHKYKNEFPITPEEVCEKINQSKCGLILSHTEGACFASSEYLLCGIPVVSTPSFGGRDVWYNEDNSIVCAADEDSVKDAVDKIKLKTHDPQKIRENYITQSKQYRNRFINEFQYILDKFGVTDIYADRYFYENYFHKIRKSHKPNLEQIFRGNA
jgi:glycosyltransferase involved in cell wall biosynthesis